MTAAVDIDPDTSKGWLRRLWPIVSAHRSLLAFGAACGIVALATQVAVPAVAREAIDSAGDGFGERLRTLVILLGVLAIARGLTGGAYRYLLFKLSLRVDSELRMIVHRHLSRLSFSFYDRSGSGDIISRANTDIRSIQILFAFAPMLGMAVLTFFLAFGLMLWIHVPLTLVALATLPIGTLVGNRFRNRFLPLSWIIQGRSAEVASVVDENVNGTRVVKSFAAERAEIAKLARAARRLQWASATSVDVRARYNPLLEALPRIAMGLVLLYGGWLAIDGQVTIGTLFAFGAYIIMLQLPFRMFGFIVMQSQRAAASAERIFQVLDTPPEITSAPGARVLDRSEGRLTFDDVTFTYGQEGRSTRPILDGFSLEISPGETVALVGPTGCGKSTVARLAARFYDAGGGTVRLDGHDVRDLELESLRRNVVVAFDEPFLFSVPLRDNIAFGRPDASLDEVIRAARIAQIHETVANLPEGYDTVVGERGYTLSGGQRQRIALARALLPEPAVLILDDALSAVDMGVEEAIGSALRTGRAGGTTLLIAHRLSTISLADRVIFTEGGRVVATGTHAELMATRERYVQVLADAEARAAEGRRGEGAAGLGAKGPAP
ncbi:MAG: ABC transporter ATP-binding protein [Acidimicrobiia bacterium]|nr:ABC transporter ATP-binding protein [Acidimicrobiia bacterium]